MARKTALSEKAQTILAFIATGHTYDQILAAYPNLTYPDIFDAAREALEAAAVSADACRTHLAEVQQKHPRAQERWAPGEDALLREMLAQRKPVTEISATLQRQESAITSRIRRLGLARK